MTKRWKICLAAAATPIWVMGALFGLSSLLELFEPRTDASAPAAQPAPVMSEAELREKTVDMLYAWCAEVGKQFGETQDEVAARTADAVKRLRSLGIDESVGNPLLAAGRYGLLPARTAEGETVPPPPYDKWLSDYVRHRRAGRTWEQAADRMEANFKMHYAWTVQRVVAVVDGDTIRIADKFGEEALVRLRRVNAPELDEPGGPEARDALRERLASGRVWVEPRAHDVYGRIVADVSPTQ